MSADSSSDPTAVLETIGRAVASMHASNLLYGNLHPDTLRIDDEGRLILDDFSRAKSLDRPPTSAERAGDLLPLKLNLDADAWLLVQSGYLSEAPKEGYEVFELMR